MPPKTTFSIIIPVRQTNDYVSETLSYLKTQSLKSFEVLVITDKISHSPNPAIKRNLGAKMARGKYLAFLDDDSYPSIDWLKNAQIQIESNPQISAVCGPCLTPPSDNYLQQANGLIWASPLGSGGAGTYRNSPKNARFVDDFPSVNLIVKKDIFDKVGGFKTKYWPGEDTLLCLDIANCGKNKILYHPDILVYHHRRSLLRPHLKQIGRYAFHRGNFARKFPQTSFRLGYLIPSIFSLYLIILIPSLLLLTPFRLVFISPLILYILLLAFTFVSFLKTNPITTSLLAAISIPITHVYYGILFMIGFFKKNLRYIPKKVDSTTGKYQGG